MYSSEPHDMMLRSGRSIGGPSMSQLETALRGNEIQLSEEQRAFLSHDPRRHGRLLAGPGAGKTLTCVAYLEHILKEHPDRVTQMLTFTRAATADFTEKIRRAGLGDELVKPKTVHGFALSLLLKARASEIPIPLRLPDKWEERTLIHPHIAVLLQHSRHEAVTPRIVRKLQAEMAAGWESLDPSAHLIADLSPELRNAYIGIWTRHRGIFHYALVSELPMRAAMLLEDVGTEMAISTLLVDEYQDLNAADIRLFRALANIGVKIIAIGDDDQSIYAFRHADPSGIRRFLEEFSVAHDYSLTESRRCGSRLLSAANELIQTDPDRQPRSPLRPLPGAPEGEFHYLRFQNEEAEVEGVGDFIQSRIASGVHPKEIAVLVRSSEATWAGLLGPALARRGLEIACVDTVTRALEDTELRHGLALAHLAIDRTDSLSWWTLLHLERGIGHTAVQRAFDSVNGAESFGEAFLRLHQTDYPGFTSSMATKLRSLVSRSLPLIEAFETENINLDMRGWGGWLLDHLDAAKLSDDAKNLLIAVGSDILTTEGGLQYFLGQIEPLGKDLALSSQNGVRLMTMTQSKGLTFNTVIILGVEEGIIPMPPPKGGTLDEERRLLYVAITRPTDVCIMTYVRQRRGVTSFRGNPNFGARRRSSLIQHLSIGQHEDASEFLARLPDARTA